MTPKAAVYRAAWVIPVSAPPVSSGAVRVSAAGRIEAIGPAEEVSTEGARVVELGSAAILPGLVNLHAHPELTLLRGRLETGPFPEWVEQLKRLKYEVLSPEALRVSTWLGVAEAIAAGVTCLAGPDDAGFLQESLVEAGLRGRVYREVFGPAPGNAEGSVRELRRKLEAMRERETGLVETGVSPHAPYTVSARLFALLADFASSTSTPVTLHAAESEAEVEFVRNGEGPFADRLRARNIEVRATGESPIAWLAETGILETGPLLAHCVRVDADDVARLADAGASIAHCPVSNAKFGHGVAPLLSFLEAGVPVGLGTDSVASNNRMDVLEEARFAGLSQRSTHRAPGVLGADELLRLATLGGARALGLADGIGSLEVGKEADLIAVRLDRPHTTPVGEPTAALIHSAGAGDVRLTVVRGRVLFRDGEFTTLDWGALAEEGVRAAAASQIG